MIEMEYLSHSRIEVFQSCPRLFKLRYIDKAEPENETYEHFGLYGSILHYVTETFFRNRGLVPKSVLVEMFLHGADNDDGEHVKGFEEIVFGGVFKNARDSYYRSGMDYIDRLITYDTSKTIGVEQEFLIKVADGIPPLKGFVDRIDKTDDGYEIWDYKTSKSYGQEKCDSLPQVGIYSLACLSMFGSSATRMYYDFIRVNDRIETTRTDEQLEQVRQDIIDTWYEICKSDWQPRYDSWYCQAFCDHNRSCDLFKMEQEKERIAKEQRRAAKLAKQSKGGDV